MTITFNTAKQATIAYEGETLGEMILIVVERVGTDDRSMVAIPVHSTRRLYGRADPDPQGNANGKASQIIGLYSATETSSSVSEVKFFVIAATVNRSPGQTAPSVEVSSVSNFAINRKFSFYSM